MTAGVSADILYGANQLMPGELRLKWVLLAKAFQV
jgi:hypothetical protein